MINAEDLNDTQWIRVEAYSFWCLSRLMEGTQDHYTRDQPGIQRKLQALQSLISQTDCNIPIGFSFPDLQFSTYNFQTGELDQHLASQEVLYSFFAYRWMNCVSVISIWDHG